MLHVLIPVEQLEQAPVYVERRGAPWSAELFSTAYVVEHRGARCSCDFQRASRADP
jgi:hypothetical protein